MTGLVRNAAVAAAFLAAPIFAFTLDAVATQAAVGSLPPAVTAAVTAGASAIGSTAAAEPADERAVDRAERAAQAQAVAPAPLATSPVSGTSQSGSANGASTVTNPATNPASGRSASATGASATGASATGASARPAAAKKATVRKARTKKATRPAAPAPTSGSGPATAPAPASSPVATGFSSMESQVIALTNGQRAANGCGALRTDGRLTAAARTHSADMVRNNFFSHTGSDGSSFVMRVSRTGFSGASAENIAWGWRTAQVVVDQWMNSPGHRANILNCANKSVGVGVAKKADGTPYWTQDFGRV